MSEPTNIVQFGGNLTALKKDIKAGADKIISLMAERAATNTQIGEVYADLVAKGVPKRAMTRAVQDIKTQRDDEGGPEKRQGIDAGYAIAREALLLPPQLEMFPPETNKQNDADETGEASGDPDWDSGGDEASV